MTGSMNDFARLSEMNVGDAVKLDAGFDCGIAGKTLVVNEDDRGLFVACGEGRHYLDGQLADDGDRLVGVYRVEGETVEVWSTQTPALNGTALVVSTTPDVDTFELIVADLLPDDDDADEEPGAMCKRALKKAEADIASRMGVPLSAVSSDFNAPETIALTRDRLTSALREAAAQGMDRTSGQWSGYAASCREIADRIAKDIEAGRFSSDNYHYLDSDRRAS